MSIRDEVTNKILGALAEGVPPWHKGWTSCGLHINASTGKAYRGINQILLGMQCTGGDSRWLTYRQARELGYVVRKGERSTKIVRLVEIDRPSSGSASEGDVIAEESNRRLVLRTYDVFNARQIEGMPPLPQTMNSIEPNDAVEAVVEGMKRTGLKVIYGSTNAYFSPHIDTVRLPVKEAFHSAQDLWSTLFHELSHSTGAAHRLNRDMGRPNSEDRAREELRAEIASAMMCAEANISLGPHHVQNHASYLASWISLLRNDSGEIFRAASDAQTICDYLQEHALKIEPRATSTPVISVHAPTSAPRPAFRL